MTMSRISAPRRTSFSFLPLFPLSVLLLLFVSFHSNNIVLVDARRNRNNNNNGAPSMDQHNDASTGTITQMTDSQQASSHAAMTCDDIMARSVVLANEEKVRAQAERTEALAELKVVQAASTKLETDLHTAKETQIRTKIELEARIAVLEGELTTKELVVRAQADKDIAAAQKELQEYKDKVDETILVAKTALQQDADKAKETAAAAVEEMKVQVAEKIAAADKTLQDAQKSFDRALKEQKAKAAADQKALEAKVVETQKSADELLEREQTRWNDTREVMKKEHATHIEELQRQSSLLLSDSESTRDAKIDELTKLLEEEGAKHAASIKKLTATAKAEAESLVSKHALAVEELKKQHDTERTKLEKEIHETKTTKEKELNETKTDLSSRMKLMRQSSEKELTEVSTTHQKEKKALQDKIRALEKEGKSLKANVEETTKKLNNAVQVCDLIAVVVVVVVGVIRRRNAPSCSFCDTRTTLLVLLLSV